MAVFNSFAELIGKTPLLKLTNFNCGENVNIYAKLESFNPASSAKDRVALKMIEDAEKSGALKKGATIIEPTSGNTGIGLCAVAAIRGYKIIIVMPETMSEERKKLMQLYGAELVLTDGLKGMAGSIEKANELAKEIEGAFVPSQFENPSNAQAHYLSTGPEIYEDLEGKVDIFVAGVGTGGTLSGVGRFLKEKNPDVEIVAVEPSSSAVLSGEKAGAHTIQGIGAGFIPKVLDTSVIDRIIKIENDDAKNTALKFVKSEGVFVGISSGAALSAALSLAKEEKNRGKNIVVLLPDTGERYLSTFI